MLTIRFTPSLSRRLPVAFALLLPLSLPTAPARAQAIAAVVNGEVITTEDVDEAMKYLRIMKLPSSRDAAVDTLIADRIKLREANKFGVDANDSDLSTTLNRLAAQLKTSPNALAAAFQKSKSSSDAVRNHLHAIAAWNNYVRNRNKALSVSAEDVTSELAKDPAKATRDPDYTLQQIVFVVPAKSNPAVLEQRMREAQALRARFQDCSSGLPLARALPDVGVKPPVSRLASSLSESTRSTLEQTPRGKLTPPERSVEGIQMIAVCGKDDADKTSLRDNIRADLTATRLSKVGDQMYQEIRKTAVVQKR